MPGTVRTGTLARSELEQHRAITGHHSTGLSQAITTDTSISDQRPTTAPRPVAVLSQGVASAWVAGPVSIEM